MINHTNYFVAGIDISSKSSVATILSPNGEIYGKKLTITNNLSGFKKLHDILVKIYSEHNIKTKIFMESTGLYHILLFNYFSKCGYECFVINPIKTKNFAKQSIRKVKNDKIDSLRIAQLAQSPTFINDSIFDENFFILKKLCREYSSLISQRAQYKKKLISSLNIVFPNFSSLFSDPFSPIPLAILKRCPSYDIFLSTSKQEIVNLIISTVNHSKEWAEAKYNAILQVALECKELKISSTALNIEILCFVNIIDNLSLTSESLLNHIKEFCKEIPLLEHNINLLCSHPEVGFISAVSLLAEIGNINNFKNAKKLVAFVGVDSTVCQSGNFNSTHNKLSKRGSNYCRKILFNLAIASIKTRRNGVAANPVLLSYYKKLCEKKPKKVAICAVMHKLINHFFAILRDQKPFELRLPETHQKLYIDSNLKAIV